MGTVTRNSCMSPPLHSENAISGLADVSPACVPKGQEWEEESDPGLAAFSLQPSTSLHIEVVFNHNSQFKGSFSTVEFLCPTDGCWDPGLLLSHNKELMAGQIPKGIKAQLAPSHIEELTCQQGLAEIC